jgi:hypothetical protein
VVRALWQTENPAGVLLEVSGLENGTYALIVNGVSDTSGNVLSQAFYPFEVVSLSIGEMPAGLGFRAYPNPSGGVFHIEMSGSNDAIDQLIMRDITGNAIPLEWTRDASGIRVCSQAPAGSYVVLGLAGGRIAWHCQVLIF